MRISIATGNHKNSSSITDTVLFLRSALQDCGHRAEINPGIMPGCHNILIEHFVDVRSVREVFEAHAMGARYILIGTEPIIGGSFNNGIDASHWHYSNAAYWQLRFDAFKAVAQAAGAIWVLAESMVAGYAELFPDVPVRFLPHGHVSNFATVRQRPEAERDIDFYFSGSLTDHRRRILDTLLQKHSVVVHDQTTPEYLRQDQLSRSKVCLSLRLSAHNDIASVSRLHFHLQNRSFLLHETCALPCPLDPFVLQAPTADLITWARAALDLPNRRALADGMHDRFQAGLPMSRYLLPLLDEALQRPAHSPRAQAA